VRRVIAVPPALVADLDRVVTRLRNATPARLRASVTGPFANRADAARALAQMLAQSTQGIEDAAAPAPPVWRIVPVLSDTAIGDQLRVLVHDFVSAVPNAPAEVWAPDGRTDVEDLLRDVHATVAEVARYL
jgi:hypothetical protein